MSFDFDTVIDRANSDSQKWGKYAGQDVLPLWVADMDFASPPAVAEALQRRVSHQVFGYAKPSAALHDTVVGYVARHYGWKIEPSWIVWLPGLVTGLNVAAAAYGSDGDGILSFTPVYPPFMSAPANRRRKLVAVPFARNERTLRHEIDWDALARATTPSTSQLFLCSPHNPVGRAFSREELTRLAAFAVERDLVVTSDEIHCDLILDDVKHVPFATLSPGIAARTVTLMAPSKTYNIPGLGSAFAIIPDSKLRLAFVRSAAGMVPDINLLGLVACEAALRDGEAWRQDLLRYLRGNRDYLQEFVARELPGIRMGHVEATYLAWLDVSALKLENPGRFFETHGVGLADGAQYAAAPGTHVRLNFGCPRKTLVEALARMKRGLRSA
jgi:cysteine-S-conjugate beta-lyase